MRVIRYGCGVREDWPRYPSSEMGSSGGDRMLYAQSNREIASHSSRSATWIAGQMRRLRHAHSNKTKNEGKKQRQRRRTGFGWLEKSKRKKMLLCFVPCTERPMVSVHWIDELARFSTRQYVSQEALRFESESVVDEGGRGGGGVHLSVLSKIKRRYSRYVRTGLDTSPRCDGSRRG